MHRVNTASVERGVLAPPPIFPRWGLAPVGAMRWGALSVVLTAFAVAFEAPARRFRGAPSRVVAVRSYVEARSGTFGSYVEGLEDKCSSGDDEACQLLDQLSGYARSLEDLRSRRSRAPDAPDISAAAPASFAGANGAAAAGGGSFAPAGIAEDSVPGALVRLFDAYDTRSAGVVPVEVFTSRWVSNSMANTAQMGATRSWDWSARQARAGARRISRLFAPAETVTQADFVAAFSSEYEKRIARGPSESRAIAEIYTNMPQRELFAEMYGSE